MDYALIPDPVVKFVKQMRIIDSMICDCNDDTLTAIDILINQ